MGLDLKPLVTPMPLKLSELAGKVVAIDAYNTIYQFLSIIRGPTGELLTNSKGEVTTRHTYIAVDATRPAHAMVLHQTGLTLESLPDLGVSRRSSYHPGGSQG